MRGFFLFVRRTPVATLIFGSIKAMSLFRCHDKLADLFMYAKFMVLSAIGTSLITSKHKKPNPLVSRGIIGGGIFNTKNGLRIEEE